MKTERITILTTPAFKSFLTAEARRSGTSVGEWVRARCENRLRDEDEALLAAATVELRKSTREARKAIAEALAETRATLAELRARRSASARVARRKAAA